MTLETLLGKAPQRSKTLVVVVDVSHLTLVQIDSLSLNMQVQAEAYWEPGAPVAYPDCDVIGSVVVPHAVDSQQVADLALLWAT
jgi:hypothetical protein